MISPLLLRDWEGSPVKGWFMSEKLDGWRMLWDGQQFFSRSGNVFNVPDWFADGMPETPLDGELFLGRGEFNAIQSAMAGGWFGLRFHVFDIPADIGTYRERLKALKSIALPDHVEMVPQVRCEGLEHLLSFAGDILASGGEGAVTRNPRAIYAAGRSGDVLRWVPQDPALSRVRSRSLSME